MASDGNEDDGPVNKAFHPYQEPTMISATSSSGQPRHAEAPAPLSLLLDIPRDVVPNICTRLAGPGLLTLVRTCKQMETSRKAMLKTWASEELHEIAGLGDEELWTRFLDLVANAADMIDGGDWEAFLAKVDTRQAGHAELMQLAVLTSDARQVHTLPQSTVYLLGSELGSDAYDAFSNLVVEADVVPWMAKAAGKVFTGLWRHAVLQHEDVDLDRLEALFRCLSLSTQTSIMPFFDSPHGGYGHVPTEAYVMVSTAHTQFLDWHFSGPPPHDNLAGSGPRYLACLGRIFEDRDPLQRLGEARGFIKTCLARSLKNEKAMRPWRQQSPEFALLVFLALAWKPVRHEVHEPLERKVISAGFIGKQESNDFFLCMDKGFGSPSEKVAGWLSSNRPKEAPAKSEPSCAVS
jgi:hypothetical protein